MTIDLKKIFSGTFSSWIKGGIGSLLTIGALYIWTLIKAGKDVENTKEIETIVVQSQAIKDSTMAWVTSTEVLTELLKKAFETDALKHYTKSQQEAIRKAITEQIIRKDSARAGIRDVISITADVSREKAPYHLGDIVAAWTKGEFVMKKDVPTVVRPEVRREALRIRNLPRNTEIQD